MLNQQIKLNQNIFDEDAGSKAGLPKMPTRNGFGDGVVEAGKEDERIVVLTADLAESVRADKFAKEFPNRFFEVGIAEQNLASVASGLAAMGKIPFATSYAIFSPGRNWEQIRTTICYNNQPVKIVGSHAGLLTGPDGGTHQALEDLTITRVLPNMVVISPCDYQEARKATLACALTKDPTYLRLCRDKTPQITTAETPFEIGKAVTLFESKNKIANLAVGETNKKNKKFSVGFISTGVLTYQTLLAAKKLDEDGIAVKVINIHTIKPIDEKAIIELAKDSEIIVTAEEHQIAGGLGGVVAEVLAQNYPTLIGFVGVKDKYGESGEGAELLKQFEIDEVAIEKTARKVLEKLKDN